MKGRLENEKKSFSRVVPTWTSAAITLVMQAIGPTDFVKEIDPQNQDPLLPKRKTIFQSRATKGFPVGSLSENNHFERKKNLTSR